MGVQLRRRPRDAHCWEHPSSLARLRLPRGEGRCLGLQAGSLTGSSLKLTGLVSLIGLSVWLLINIYKHIYYSPKLVQVFINQKDPTPSEDIQSKPHKIFTTSCTVSLSYLKTCQYSETARVVAIFPEFFVKFTLIDSLCN